jgi:hypothetical protein
MADAVTVSEMEDTARRAVYRLTSVSDGTGESAVQKIDISTLQNNNTSVKIKKVWWSITTGMSVNLAFDHTTDDTGLVLTGSGYHDYSDINSIDDPGSAGGTGDIMLTTIGHAANDTYTIIIELDVT